MPTGLLYRVGIDSASGGWNAPCRADGSFCYVPIADGQTVSRGPQFDHAYDEFSPFVTSIGATWPRRLAGACHLDPDFANLTYGDAGSRARRIRQFVVPGSFIVFWSALRWLDGPQQGGLVCSLIGFFRVARVLSAKEVDACDAHRNAHTRQQSPGDDHLVVFADPHESGRLRRHIPIGERRAGAQRVFPHVLADWGGLCRKSRDPLKDGYIQLSGSPPIFTDPDRFLRWFGRQQPELVHANNVISMGGN
jgi:Nucleotide modification associated domain 3